MQNIVITDIGKQVTAQAVQEQRKREHLDLMNMISGAFFRDLKTPVANCANPDARFDEIFDIGVAYISKINAKLSSDYFHEEPIMLDYVRKGNMFMELQYVPPNDQYPHGQFETIRWSANGGIDDAIVVDTQGASHLYMAAILYFALSNTPF